MPTSEAVLARIRKLLAVAEHPATPPAEAEAAAEAAERLILKHAIDEALLDAKAETHSKPELRSIELDPPYVSAKIILLAHVAAAHGVEVIGHGNSPRATMVGFRSDLDLVDLLFTSLLLQAATAMLRQPNTGRAFRRAFLIGFASVVGQRLAAARAAAVAEATNEAGGASTELALRNRDDEVVAAMHEHFPRLGTARTSISNGEGLMAGQRSGAAANLAAGGKRLDGKRASISN